MFKLFRGKKIKQDLHVMNVLVSSMPSKYKHIVMQYNEGIVISSFDENL